MTPQDKKEAYNDEGPPALLEYRGREIARTMHWQGAPWLMRKLREEEEKTSEMIRELQLKPGLSVAIGSGNGYHTLMMAEIIGEKGQPMPLIFNLKCSPCLRIELKKQG